MKCLGVVFRLSRRESLRLSDVLGYILPRMDKWCEKLCSHFLLSCGRGAPWCSRSKKV